MGGVDGCGVPSFGVSVRATALMTARLVAPREEWPRGLGVALKLEDGDRKERARP